MRLKDEKVSKNFEDRTGGSLSDSFHNMMYRLLYPFVKMVNPKQISPETNDAYLENIRRMGKPQADYMNMTVKDFTPEEWKLIKNNGFSLDDIMVMRQRRPK